MFELWGLYRMKVLECIKDYDKNNNLILKIKFQKGKKRGSFIYYLTDEEIGECDYEESENEDIYSEIHDWIEKNVMLFQIVKVKGKVL